MLIPNTSVLVQATPAAGGLALWSDVAGIVVAVAALVMAGLAGTLFLKLNSVLGELRRSVRQNLGPVSDRARSISDNVEFITQALRSDVEKLNASVEALTDRLHLASERMEERIEEFNALMEVVQGEAEELFLDTASTVRGVREGARAITRAVPGVKQDDEPPGDLESIDEDLESIDDDPESRDQESTNRDVDSMDRDVTVSRED